MARRRRVWIIALVALVVLVGGAVVRHRLGNSNQAIIRTTTVKRGDVTAGVSGNGVLEAWTTMEVKSNVGGQVVELAVDEGDTVRAGQLIARIDPSDSLTNLRQSQAELESGLAKVRQAEQQAHAQPALTDASIRQAQSALDSAQATLRQTKTASNPQKLASAQSGYDQARATYDRAEKNLARQRALLEQGFVPKSQVEAAEEQYSVAKAQLESAKNKLETVKDETDQELKVAEARMREAKAALESAKVNAFQERVRREEIIQAKAEVARAQATVKNARTQLGYTTIVAPRPGVVVKKYVEAGSIITAGRSSFGGTGAGITIVEIADVSNMLAVVNVDETDIAQIEVGQTVDVSVDAYPDELFTGKVTKIAPQAVVDQDVTTIPVTVQIEQPDLRLKPGMNVTCDFITGRRENVLFVPNEAIKETDTGFAVTVMNHGKQVPRKVEVGITGNDDTEIVRGLREGETVVTAVIEPTTEQQSPSGSQRGMHGGPPPF